MTNQPDSEKENLDKAVKKITELCDELGVVIVAKLDYLPQGVVPSVQVIEAKKD